MPSKLVDPKTIPTQTFDWGLIKPLVAKANTDNPAMSLLHVVLLPGKGHTRHNHPDAESLFVFLDHPALVLVNGQERELGAGEAWEHDRYRGPYLRDALLDAGALVETLETVSFWSAVPRLYAAVSGALRASLTDQGTPPVVLCHVSHVYPAGASLYFTVACAQADDPVAQWRAAKAAASDAILEAGGSITHHHGVGTDHRDWYEREVGELAIAALRAVKATLDPAGIMNPGVLIPPG